jgi:integrase/recombinase XerD
MYVKNSFSTSFEVAVTAEMTRLPAADAFAELEALALRSLPSAASSRVYAQTFRLWRAYCTRRDHSPFDMTPGYVVDFLTTQNTTKATRQRQLSALRKLAQMAYILNPDDTSRRIYEALKVVKAPAPGEVAASRERTRRALAPSQADKLLRQWSGNGNAERRNRALVSVLLLGGVRRSEAAALRWSDVDFENGILHIRHGKGDKTRDVPLAGDFALQALRSWQMAQPTGCQYVFTPVARGDHHGSDRPLSGTDVYRIWAVTAEAAGVESKPHDARRTFITEALATGTPIQTVQAVVGHARGETTLRYAQSVDARRARRELKLRYGDN